MMAAADLFLVAMGATPSQRPEAIRRFFQRCTAWRVAFYNVGLQVAQLVGQQRRKWFDRLKADVIKVFSELRCDVLCLSEMESAFA